MGEPRGRQRCMCVRAINKKKCKNKIKIDAIHTISLKFLNYFISAA